MNKQQTLVNMFNLNWLDLKAIFGKGEDMSDTAQAAMDKIMKEAFPESGFFNLPQTQTCNHPEHNPPNYLYIPPGKGYRHVCPSCGKMVKIIPKHYVCSTEQSTKYI